jgi:hypothetical protein
MAAAQQSIETRSGCRCCGVHAGIAMPRAVQIVHAEVASRVRTMIINACAARRAGNTPEEMNQLLRWVVLLIAICHACISCYHWWITKAGTN